MNQPLSHDYFKAAIACSLVLLGFNGEDLLLLLKKRKEEPFSGAWYLPSRYVSMDEGVEKVARSILSQCSQKTFENVYLEQLKAFSKVFRNPEGRVINISFYALIKLDDATTKTCEKQDFKWFKYADIPDLAYDHNEIIDYAKERLKRRVKRRPVGFHLLPAEFTIAQLQALYEKALGREMDKRNFRKKIFNSQLIIDTGQTTQQKGARKVSKLYCFDEDKYEKMSLKGYDFLF